MAVRFSPERNNSVGRLTFVDLITVAVAVVAVGVEDEDNRWLLPAYKVEPIIGRASLPGVSNTPHRVTFGLLAVAAARNTICPVPKLWDGSATSLGWMNNLNCHTDNLSSRAQRGTLVSTCSNKLPKDPAEPRLVSPFWDRNHRAFWPAYLFKLRQFQNCIDDVKGHRYGRFCQ
jgi:hypothetical protein